MWEFQLKSCILICLYARISLFFHFNHLVNCICHFIVHLKSKQYFSYLSHFLKNGIWSEILGSIIANKCKQHAGSNLVHTALPSNCNFFCCFYPFSDYLNFYNMLHTVSNPQLTVIYYWEFYLFRLTSHKQNAKLNSICLCSKLRMYSYLFMPQSKVINYTKN